jgi:two-component system, OmpR family, sensor kinase
VRFVRAFPRTLRARLVLAAAGAIVVAVGLFALATVLLVEHELRSTLDTSLRQRAEQVAQLAVSAPAVLTDPGALESPVSGRQIAVQVIDSGGRLLARSETLGAHLLPEDLVVRTALARGQAGFENVRIDNRPFRLYAAPIAQAGGPASGGAVLVASDTSDIDDTVGHLGVIIAASGAGAAVLAAIAASILTGQGLRPLRRLAAGAAEIERTADPTKRLPQATSSDEIGALTGVLNRMLSSLDRARTGERRFLADASHELRTPVTALLGNVEYAQRHGADPEVLADLQNDAERLARLVDDLLVLERADADVVAEPEAIELHELVREAVKSNGQGRVLISDLESARVRGEPDSLARALANLIENALVHGPTGRPVTAALRVDAGRALLSVSDEGPGPAPADRERLFERFWRGPGSTGRPGSGLGLSIVRAIAERHGGQVSVEDSTFTIELPLDEVSAREGSVRAGSET